jgi:hypothetical protein
MPPTPEEQIKFLVNLQRLLDEGLFVASYKFALLLALTDLSVDGDDSGAPVPVTTADLSERLGPSSGAEEAKGCLRTYSPTSRACIAHIVGRD